MAGEFDFIRALRQRTPAMPGVLVGPGDDCAVLAPRRRATLVTTDLLTEGVDFLLAETSPEFIGRKAMGVNLSDIAAMAGLPVAAVVSVALPRTPPGLTTRELAERLDAGLRAMAGRFDLPIVGGDTNTWDGGLVVCVTLLGEASERGAVTRSGAKPGDAIFVTGPVGGSLLGRHLDPQPRIREAHALHELVDLHAMIDISDGLAADLQHILTESRCGAELLAASIPIHADATRRSALTGRTPLEHALHDGEDFELIFAVREADAARVPPPCVRIGTCLTAGAGLWLTDGGQRRPLRPEGWVHSVT